MADWVTCLSVPVRGGRLVAVIPDEPAAAWKRLMDDDPCWNTPWVTKHWKFKVDGPIRPSKRTPLRKLIKFHADAR